MTAFTIPWIQNLAGPADDFDEDHWRLLDKVNTLLQAVSSANETGVLMACSGLRVAAQEHFARERRRCVPCGTPTCSGIANRTGDCWTA